ncbi:hypothetical protein HWE04_14320 [Herbaspirillum sp. C7C2]|uniref:hypothetical protein n=1 Tax=Herbaspirillum sp. C7C2 TaxID=2736666 RepID=UPI001F52550F|nr:hypothetical protein [Herbaspirillum sp. C7C2]MCI1015027.1 hypothetical protein [Herbaspirillum sp. C7C2]
MSTRVSEALDFQMRCPNGHTAQAVEVCINVGGVPDNLDVFSFAQFKGHSPTTIDLVSDDGDIESPIGEAKG